jgi:hypothetical protein
MHIPCPECRVEFLEGHAERIERDATELASQVDNLAMLVRRLAHKVRNLSPDSSLADRAMAYLTSKGLQGEITRDSCND